MEVELVLFELQRVAAASCLDSIRAEQLAERRNVALERVPRRRGRTLPPESVECLVGRDDLTGSEEQKGEQGA